MATMFVQQSQGYIQQVEEGIERLQQLVEQVKATIHSEEELENG
jgi:archaellum component FlaC